MTDTIEDGVLVSRTPITLPNGSSAIRTSIPVITEARNDTVSPSDTADIQVGYNLVSLPVGYGLTAITSDLLSKTDRLAAIESAIKAVPGTLTEAESAYFSRYIEKELSSIIRPSQTNVATLSVITDSKASNSALNISSSTNLDVANVTVLDLTQASGASVSLSGDVTAVLGSGTVYVYKTAIGDDANQTFIAPSRGGSAYAGGGDDRMEFYNNIAWANSVFHGGQGYDTFVSDGLFEPHAGYVIMHGGRSNEVKLINVERIEKTNGEVIQINVTTEQKAVATLYKHILDRQPDLAGFEYWDNQIKAGKTLGDVAIAMTRSTESGDTLFNGNTSHDLDTLYNVILNRPTDAVGKAYWSAQIDQGLQTLAQVAQGFVTSNELVAAYIPQTEWNFFV